MVMMPGVSVECGGEKTSGTHSASLGLLQEWSGVGSKVLCHACVHQVPDHLASADPSSFHSTDCHPEI